MREISKRPIGIFDSGVGGLTVARSIKKYLKNEDIIYFGDTARVPYGNKSKSTIIRFSNEIMKFLIKHKVKMVVVACNTASSFSLPQLKNRYDLPIIGVISPGVKEAVLFTKNNRIGVIGTNSTISSGAYDRELEKVNKKSILFSTKCPLFVHLVENGFTKDKITYEVVKKYLTPFKKQKIDTLILGCTHYPLIKNVIQKVMPKVKLIDSSYAVAKEVKRRLDSYELCNQKKSVGKMKCYVSDDVKDFKRTAGLFLKEKISVQKVVF